jgi:Icc protein
MKYFLHISDTHFGPSPEYFYQNTSAQLHAEMVLELIEKIPYKIEFTVHTGDVAGNKDIHAYRGHYQTAFSLLARLPGPVYYVRGNHDEESDMISTFPEGHSYGNLLRPGVRIFEMSGLTGVLVDAFLPNQTAGELDADLRRDLVQYLKAQDNACCIFLHYPLLAMNSAWSDKRMLVADGQQLLDSLVSLRDKIIGIFHGHIHMPLYRNYRGIPVVAAPSTLYQFHHGPDRPVMEYDLESPIGCNLVGWDENGIVVFEQRISPRRNSV